MKEIKDEKVSGLNYTIFQITALMNAVKYEMTLRV